MKTKPFLARAQIAWRVFRSFLPWRSFARISPARSLPVKIRRQWTPYSCTAAVFQMVADYHGHRVSHRAAIRMVGCKPDGASIDQLAVTLKAHLLLRPRLLSGVRQVRTALQRGHVVMSHDDHSYINPHAVLIIGATAKGFWIADPALGECRWMHERGFSWEQHEFFSISTPRSARSRL